MKTRPVFSPLLPRDQPILGLLHPLSAKGIDTQPRKGQRAARLAGLGIAVHPDGPPDFEVRRAGIRVEVHMLPAQGSQLLGPRPGKHHRPDRHLRHRLERNRLHRRRDLDLERLLPRLLVEVQNLDLSQRQAAVPVSGRHPVVLARLVEVIQRGHLTGPRPSPCGNNSPHSTLNGP